ncbi:MAG: hypothetical protein CMO04_02280 [Thalassospira sp.]|uniref:Uncharacterized protein n=1 Tax=Thalassospira povalilytica TaxID=732237 RepID=A0ABX4R8V0_9PROT|nr:hypothetical protein [Thalassospira sp.]PKR50136.1 hypothetical protein CU041_10555 [Thalassospira povalilytica]
MSAKVGQRGTGNPGASGGMGHRDADGRRNHMVLAACVQIEDRMAGHRPHTASKLILILRSILV